MRKKHKLYPMLVIALVAMAGISCISCTPGDRKKAQEALQEKVAEATENLSDRLAEKTEDMTGKLSDRIRQLGRQIEQGSLPDSLQPSLSALPARSNGLELPASLKGKREERILKRMTYTVSYNEDWNLPNWVAWELNREKLIERESRSDKFLPDPDLPRRKAVVTKDYSGSGWDRGHMCPASDNRWHFRAMQESFYMTNICPQHHNLNRGDWKELEEASRRWAEKWGSIYICCGPILYRGKHRTIGREHTVIVPEAFFKVILCTATRPARAIGFIYKNTAGNHALDAYVNTVDQVERITGIDFFAGLPDEVEKEVEAGYKLSDWEL